LPTASPDVSSERKERVVVRSIGLDVHLDFCEVAIVEDGELRSAGRIETKPERIELFAGSLSPDDRVALEVTGNAWEIARIIEPHVAQVLVVSPSDIGIRQARAKTDRLDARTLARLLAAGSLDAVWMPDRATWVMRRRLARRGQLVRSRSRAKNQIHAVLMRQLVGRPPVSDLFGVKGRRWLAGIELALEERETVDAAMRQIEFLDTEIAAVERLIARDALDSGQIRRLMTVPGVNVIVAASFIAAIGDIDRFKSPRKLVGYLGLDPRVRQSGPGPATHGHISKQGSVRARHALVEACWTAVRQPGPLHAFYQRVRARRGHSVAIVAAARKLACLFWCPAHARAGLRLRPAVANAQEAAPARTHRRPPAQHARCRRHLARQRRGPPGRARARSAGRDRLPADRARLPRHAGEQGGRERDTGTRTFRPSERQAARQGVGPRPCALARRRPRPHPKLSQGAPKESNAA
jgi:transposase